MSVQFPAPAPSTPEGPGFPVYSPDNNRNEAPKTASERMASISDPLAAYQQTVRGQEQTEPREERELLFTIMNVDVYAPRDEDIPPNLAFKMIRDIRKHGPIIAVANMVGELLGDEALDALADIPKGAVKDKDWNIMMEILGEKVFSKFQNVPGVGGKG